MQGLSATTGGAYRTGHETMRVMAYLQGSHPIAQRYQHEWRFSTWEDVNVVADIPWLRNVSGFLEHEHEQPSQSR